MCDIVCCFRLKGKNKLLAEMPEVWTLLPPPKDDRSIERCTAIQNFFFHNFLWNVLHIYCLIYPAVQAKIRLSREIHGEIAVLALMPILQEWKNGIMATHVKEMQTEARDLLWLEFIPIFPWRTGWGCSITLNINILVCDVVLCLRAVGGCVPQTSSEPWFQ